MSFGVDAQRLEENATFPNLSNCSLYYEIIDTDSISILLYMLQSQ